MGRRERGRDEGVERAELVPRVVPGLVTPRRPETRGVLEVDVEDSGSEVYDGAGERDVIDLGVPARGTEASLSKVCELGLQYCRSND